MMVSGVGSADRTQAGASGYLEIAARRKAVIALPIAAAAASAYLVASSLPPQYAAEAIMALDERMVQVIEIDSVVSRLPRDDAALRTELDALTSRSMAARVAERLDLVHDPEFLRQLYAPHSTWQRLTVMLQEALHRFVPSVGAASPEPAALVATPPGQSTAINWLLGGVRASNDGRSFTIHLSFVSQSAELSARVANAFADGYLADQIELKVRATRDASAWLRGRLEEMRRELEASEAAVQRFRREADLLEVSGATMAAQQLSELNSQLVSARTERLQLEARLQSVRQIAQNGRNADASSDILTSPTIQALRLELSQANAEAQPFRGELGPRHPTTIALESRLTSLSRQLAFEIESARRSLENEVVAARNQEAELDAMLRATKGQYGEAGESFVSLNQLQRESEANRALYESLLKRYKETIEQETLATSDARLLSRAVPPDVPSGPRRLPILVLGFATGAGIGAALAIALEWSDRSVRRISEIEDITGLSVFGVLPSVAGWKSTPEEVILSQPSAPFSEALRRAHAVFRLSRSTTAVKVIMITSAASGDGKTSFCVASARALAMRGLRVLVVDADLHRPRVAGAFGCEASFHIGDVIRGRLPLEEAVCTDVRSGAHFLAAVPECTDTEFILQSGRFAAIIECVRDQYDLVIVDTPPLLPAADAASVGVFADANLFLVRWGRTPRADVMAALRFLSLCQIAADGIIMTQVNLRRQAKYGDYYESATYRRI
jgi:polysaccharide biosynthesis transport protein